MSFKPIKLVGVFSALLGASLFVSGVALADSLSNAVSTTNQETKVVLNASESTSQDSQNSAPVSSTTGLGSGQSSSNISQNATVSNASSPSTGSDQSKSTAGKTEIVKIDSGSRSVSGLASEAINGEIPNSDVGAQRQIVDSSKSTQAVVMSQTINPSTIATEQLSTETKTKINAAIAQAAPIQKAIQAQPLISLDSGGVVPVSSGNVPTPAHPTPAPMGGLGQFTAALSKIVLPLSQLANFNVVKVVESDALGTSLWMVILIIGSGMVSGFITRLRLSGFTHGARSDIPAFGFGLGSVLNMSLVKVGSSHFTGSFFLERASN